MVQGAVDRKQRRAKQEKAPDVRGGTGPLPVFILVAGWASIGLVLLGTVLLQLWYTFHGPR